MENNILGTTIKEAREEQGLSQRDLATKIGTTQTQICRIERGISKPFPSTLSKIRIILHIDLSEALRDAGYSEYQIWQIHASPEKYVINISTFPVEDQVLIQQFCAKLSKLSDKDKSIIRLILNFGDA